MRRLTFVAAAFFLLFCVSGDTASSQVSPATTERIDQDTVLRVPTILRTKEFAPSSFVKFTADAGMEFIVIRLEAQCPKGRKQLKTERARTLLMDVDGKEHYAFSAGHELPCYADTFNDIDIPFQVPMGTKVRTFRIEGIAVDLEKTPIR